MTAWQSGRKPVAGRGLQGDSKASGDNLLSRTPCTDSREGSRAEKKESRARDGEIEPLDHGGKKKHDAAEPSEGLLTEPPALFPGATQP